VLIQVSGSVAFDTIMVFEGRFKDHILADQTHMLNVAFLTPTMRQEFGGCAANIAYSLLGLGADIRLLGAVGKDGAEYVGRLRTLGADVRGLVERDDCFTAQAFITTDLDDNQITAFHPGAMNFAHESTVQPEKGLAIVSPNGKEAMQAHARGFHEAGIPFVFDPGQALPIFSASELLELISMASWVAVNDYEGEMLSRQLNQPLEQLVRRLHPHPQGGVLNTKGAEGVCVLQSHGFEEVLPALQVEDAQDPTGCGDAFRAGLLYALSQGANLLDAARLGVILGGIKVRHRGGQNHPVQRAEIHLLWSHHFGNPPAFIS